MITYLSKRTIGLDLFGRYRRQRAMQQALTRTYATFERRYPEWTASLFDKHFVKHALAPQLITAHKGSGHLTAQDIADAWAQQMTTKPARQRSLSAMALPVAAAFIQLLEQALQATDATLPPPVQHKDSRDMAAQQTITR